MGGRTLPKRVSTPFTQGYRPELDVTPELSPDQASYFGSQIGILRWCVEIGRLDIITEVSFGSDVPYVGLCREEA